MPIRNRDDAVEVEGRIARIFESATGKRGAAVRALFVEVLDFDPASGHVDLGVAPVNLALPASAERIASLDGVHVVYVALDTPETDRVRKGEVSAAAKQVTNQLDGDLLLVFTNTSASQLHLVYPSFERAQPILRRLVVERDLSRRTAIQQVSNIYWNLRESGSVRLALDQTFDVEPVTREFFAGYKRVFQVAENNVSGFGEDVETKRRFVQTLFNRLMFVYFLSRKGWLTFKGDKDYLNALWSDHRATEGENFYVNRLRPLFFAGLNNPQSRDLMRNNPVMYALIGGPPFLNGGLFEETGLDKRSGVVVPDDVIESILGDLFDRFNFTVMESTPFDVEVAVDPEMLGKVFEELVTGRHDSGAYYTPRPVVSFMCREALKGYLEGQDTGVTAEAIARFVDERDTSGISVASARKVAQTLDEVTVVDPACGSGAYLLGMMQELVELQTTLFNVGVTPKGLYDLKMHVIQRNLYGVDIDDFAVNIAMLRMWLSLAIDYGGEVPPPLPNLDFKVLCGDSLLGPNPGADSYGDLFRHRAHEVAAQLVGLKAQYMEATTGKDALKQEIERVQADLSEALADTPAPAGAVDWRVEFAEVFALRRGFDIAIANPPYVNVFRIDSDRPGYRQALKDIYTTAQGRFDLFVPFMERGIRLLAPRGMFAFITPNKYLGSQYAIQLRRFFVENATLKSISDLSSIPVFSASVYPVITIASRFRMIDEDPQVDIFRTDFASYGKANLVPADSVPLSLADFLDNNWSLFLEPHAVPLMNLLATKHRLADLSNIVPAAWVNEAYDLKDALVDDACDLTQSHSSRFVPFIVSGNIRQHRHTWASHPVKYLKSIYSNPALDLDHIAVSDARRLQIRAPKIIVSGLAKHPTCVWDPVGIAAGISTSYIIPRPEVPGAYIAGLLNSRLIGYMYRVLFGSLSLAGGYLRIGAPQLKVLPVPDSLPSIQGEIVNLIDSILATKAADPAADTSKQEWEIDRLVYDLYGLTEEEVGVVEEVLALRG